MIESDYSIEFKNLTKKFGESIILDDLNFGIHKNSITTILGFSGAGKIGQVHPGILIALVQE